MLLLIKNEVNNMYSISKNSFTSQKGGGLSKNGGGLGRSTNPLTKGKGGLGGDSHYNSYQKWVKDEITSVKPEEGPSGQTEILGDGDWSGSDSGDSVSQSVAGPKSEKEMENKHSKDFERKENNKIAREHGFSSESESSDSEPARDEPSDTLGLARKMEFSPNTVRQIADVRKGKHLEKTPLKPLFKRTRKSLPNTSEGRGASRELPVFDSPVGVLTRFSPTSTVSLPDTLHFGAGSPITNQTTRFTPVNLARGNAFVTTRMKI